jgi:PAS domain S-box-containing protein
MNKLLKRQINKYLGGIEQLPKELNTLFEAINRAYDDFDNDRKLLERSLEISSEELLGLYNKLGEEEKKTSKSEKKFKTYLDLAGVIMLALDLSGNIIFINKRGCEVLGYNINEIIGKNWFDNFIPKNERDEVKEYSKKLLSKKVGPIEYNENMIATKKGDRRLIAWHNILIKSEEGRIIGYLSSGEDITEKKKAEIKLKEKIEELQGFYKIATGRELKMIELKEKIKKLERELSICKEKK